MINTYVDRITRKTDKTIAPINFENESHRHDIHRHLGNHLGGHLLLRYARGRQSRGNGAEEDGAGADPRRRQGEKGGAVGVASATAPRHHHSG
jgi:hypothetical protein